MAKLNHTVVASIALAMLVLATFGPVLSNGFVSFDDGTYVTANPHVQSGLGSIKWAFQTSTASNWHPLTWLSHELDCQIYGLRPWGHHLTSLLLHTINSVLVFVLLRSFTGAFWPAWFVAALFGLHPLRVESVAWVAERKDVLSGLFFLLTLWAYWRHCVERGERKGKAGTRNQYSVISSRWYGVALGCFALGLLSKQMVVTLPFVLLLLDVWPLCRWRPLGIGTDETAGASTKAVEPLRRLLLEKIPFFALAALFSVIVFLVQSGAGATGMIGRLSLLARLENAVVSYARYLGKLCWPIDLAVFYPHPGYWPMAVFLGSLLLLVAITCGAWMLRRSQPFLLIGWLWYLGTLVPVIGIVQVGRQSMADRYTYIPVIGVLMAMVWGVAAWTRERRVPTRIAAVGSAAVVLFCAGLTVRQIGFWKDSETLFRHACEAVPDNYLAHGNLADCLQAQGRIDEAFREVDEALRLNPDDVNTRNSFGSVLLNLGRVDEAIGQFQEAIRRWPKFAEAHSNLGFAYRKQGRPDQALAEFRAAVESNPTDYRLQVNLAGLLMKLGKPEEALMSLEQAVRLEPGDAATQRDLAGLLANAGRLPEAVAHFQAATELEPNNVDAQAGLGICLSRLGRTQEAVEHLNQALKLKPDYAEAREELEKIGLARKQ